MSVDISVWAFNRRIPTIPSELRTQVFTEDLGAFLVDGDSLFRHEFQVRNQSNSAFRITSLSIGCSCSNIELDKRDLKPNESARGILTANLRGRDGMQRLVCNFETDSAQIPYLSYTFIVDAIPRFRVTPRSIRTPDLKPGDSHVAEIVCEWYRRTTDPVFGLGPIDNSDEVVSVTTQGSRSELLDNGVQKVTVRLSILLEPKPQLGQARGFLRVPLNSRDDVSQQFAIAEVPVICRVISPFSLFPHNVFFYLDENDSSRVTSVEVRSQDGRPFQIVAVRATPDVLSAEVVHDEARTAHEIRLCLKSSEAPRVFHGTLVILTDHSEFRAIEVPFSCIKRLLEKAESAVSSGL